MTLSEGRIEANGVDFAFLELGEGPLALCLHGFPDTAWTWRHVLPALADGGYRAVAPFLRGYAPTSVPTDGRYEVGALVADVSALHDALGGGDDAVLIGHDWGAMAAYGAAAFEPRRWRRLVTEAVPPPSAAPNPFGDFDSIQRMAYIFFFQSPLADLVVPLDEFAYLRRLWETWAPSYNSDSDMTEVRKSLGSAENLAAALGYYRALMDPSSHDPALSAESEAAGAIGPTPTLYVHGADDGCGPDPARLDRQFFESQLAPGSRFELLSGVGHFPHLEKPEDFNRLTLQFLKA